MSLRSLIPKFRKIESAPTEELIEDESFQAGEIAEAEVAQAGLSAAHTARESTDIAWGLRLHDRVEATANVLRDLQNRGR